jgi:hypothetical protein
MKYWLIIFVLFLTLSCSQSPGRRVGGKIIDKKEVLHWDAVIQQHITKYNLKISVNGSRGHWINNEQLYKSKNVGDSILLIERDFPYSLRIIEKESD